MTRDLAALDGHCPATRGTQRCASLGVHARHVWVDPGTGPERPSEAPQSPERAPEASQEPPAPDEPSEAPPPDGLVEAVALAVHDAWCQPDCHVPGHDTEPLDEAQARAAITAVRAWDTAQKPAADLSRLWTVPGTLGVPVCPGDVWAGDPDGGAVPCTLPLGHHGGCQ